jgi:membrane protease YdiL (CAAX protease family)
VNTATEQSRTRFSPFLIYLIIFHVFWGYGFVFWIYPWMKSFGEATLIYALVNWTIRSLVWVLPVFLYLRYIDHVSPVDYLKLKQNWKRGIIIGLVLSVINFFGSTLRFGIPQPDPHSLTWNSVIGTSFLIGFFEEIPYRGFILQKLSERYGFWIAALVSSLLFLGIHLPGWISLHLIKIESVISVFIFGFALALIFRYSKSLWAPIVTHSLNDFIAFILFRL